MTEETKRTGFPSIDKPWLKYYSEEAISAPLPQCTMYQYIWKNNKEHLSDIALRYYGRAITFGKLFATVEKTAAAFYAMGVRAGDIVTVMSMHTPEAICAMYALNYIGAVANMVYMTLSEKEILHTIENTQSKLFLVLDAALEKAEAVKSELPCPVVVLGVSDSMPPHIKLGYRLKAKPKRHAFLTWKDFLAKGAGPAPMAEDHTAPAVIVYTSGTTGEPKGVELSNDNLNAVVAQLLATDLNYRRRETVLFILPVFVAFGVSMMHLGISTGLELTLFLQLDADAVGKQYAKSKPNRFVMGPPWMDAIIRHAPTDMRFCIEITGGGEAAAPEKEVEFNETLKSRHARTKYMTGYGMSEFASVVTLNMDQAYCFGSLGVPLAKVNVKIADTETGEELPYHQVGELYIDAPNTMIGYYGKASDTNAVIQTDESGHRWMHTGDLASVDENGFVYFHGRRKRIYLTKTGEGDILKIYPQRIEDTLLKHPSLENCGVIAAPDQARINVPVCYVLLKSEQQDRSELLRQLTDLARAELPEHLQPAAIHILDTMPMTPSGKIDYRALEQLAAQ